ncbi:methyltransferase domain-containing protein [Candidatus Uabimicrobium sp. HlEnr_7]|uniref:methyltransferase domain-containing protein n=1 Tax=Candidatus Uabimicrobium helgolandensis TaxID=3095367 RepID=UPI003556D020
MRLMEQEKFTGITFHPTTNEFIHRYYQSLPQIDSFQARSENLFIWTYEGSRQLVLDSVPEISHEILYNTNVVAVLLNVMIDDIADMILDEKLLHGTLEILETGQDRHGILHSFPEWQMYLSLLMDIRNHLNETIKTWPQYTLWISDLVFFIRRLKTAMIGSLYFNQSFHKSKTSNWNFEKYVTEMSPPIHTFIYGIFNLMLIEELEYKEREAIVSSLYQGEQFMAMSNWLSTWEVEIEQNDYTSGVVLWALNNSILSKEELNDVPHAKQKINKSVCISDFAKKMEEKLSIIQSLRSRVSTFSLEKYIEDLREVHDLHMNFNKMLKYQLGNEIMLSQEKKNKITEYYSEADKSYQNWGNSVYELHYGYRDYPQDNHHTSLIRMNEEVAQEAKIQKGDRILDAGCGVGASVIWLAKNFNATVSGISISPLQVEKAKEFMNKHKLESQVDFSVQDYTKTNFPDNHFDVVWGLESICHAIDKKDFIKEAWRILKPNGRIVVGDTFLVREELTEIEEHALQKWLDGFAIDNLASTKGFTENLKNCSFEKVKVRDITENIMGSAQEIYQRGKSGYPDDLISKKKSIVQIKHVEACLFQKIALDFGLWRYQIISAQK